MPTLVDVTMPQMGVSVAEGTVVEWKKQVGEHVERDEIICSISTDKIDTDVESPASGVVEEILVDVDETVVVGTVMARISTGDGGEPQSPNGPTAAAAPPKESARATAPESAAPTSNGRRRTSSTQAERHYSPVVSRIAAQHGVNLDEIEGTGRAGRVRKQDVMAVIEGGGGKSATEEPPLHIESPYRPEPVAAPKESIQPPVKQEGAGATSPPSAQPARAPAAAEFATAAVRESGPLSRMRKSIGQHMKESLQTAATCTTVAEVDMTKVEAERKKLGFSYLPFVARATVEALRAFPQLNATLEGDTFTVYEDINLGIAVSLGEKGLIVPVIRQAQNYSTEGLAAKIKEIASKARNGELSPDDVRDATFTITNPGPFGSIIATPVINQPQVAILDTEAVVKRPVVVTDSDGNDSIAIRSMSYLCLSWDHRALDGAAAAQFLAELKKRLEA